MFPRGARVPMGQMYNMSRISPFQPFPGSQAPIPSRGAGGLLSKFLPKQGVMNGIQSPGQGAGGFLSNLLSKQGAMKGIGAQIPGQGAGGFLSNLLTNPGAASGMLNNIQKAVNMANQVAPMVQQYGPMVKNIPSLIKLYRELGSSDDAEDKKGVEDTVEAKDVPVSIDSKEEEMPNIKKGTSKPKLYI
ncbi:VrrA/YqfQ family protein [Bacillus sp. DJP31]|uniref:VrrA/YqfQ family protein n=1 Tax=Bacillus sp. DJP31 TaxID=3409789 RepID=UPI003BB768ED